MPTTGSQRRPAVLIAASPPELQDVLGYVMRDAAYDTAVAGDGIEVIGAVLTKSPDVVVLDAHLARLDGLLVAEILHALAPRLPVVLISSLAGPSLGPMEKRLGIFAVLRKPFRNAELLETLARALAGRSDGERASGPAEITASVSVTASPVRAAAD